MWSKAGIRAAFRTSPQAQCSAVQRSVGLFSTKEEAAEAVLAAERMLDAGVNPWPKDARKNKHKRGEAPAVPARKTAHRWGVYTTEASAKKNGGTVSAAAEQRESYLDCTL